MKRVFRITRCDIAEKMTMYYVAAISTDGSVFGKLECSPANLGQTSLAIHFTPAEEMDYILI